MGERVLHQPHRARGGRGGSARGGRLNRRVLVLGGGLALAIALAAWWGAWRPPRPPAAGASSAKATPGAIPTAQAPLWEIGPATVRLPLSSGRDPEEGARQRDLQAALAPYTKGDYAGAIVALEAFAGQHADDADALFYLGVSYLMAARPADALAPLEHAADLKTPAGRREIEWFLAAAEQRTGRLDEARRRLDRLCRVPGGYQASACTARGALM